MLELRELARTAGLSVVDTLVQRRQRVDPRFVIGKGKLSNKKSQSKAPACFDGHYWHGLGGWLKRTEATAEDAREWDQWGANAGFAWAVSLSLWTLT